MASMGIAVGMATNIPTHNVSEICDALNLMIDKPDSTTNTNYEKLELALIFQLVEFNR